MDIYGNIWKYNTDKDDVSNLPIEEIEKLDIKNIKKYDITGKYISTYYTIKEAAESIERSVRMVGGVLRGEKPHISGYIFRYSYDFYDNNDLKL